MMRFKVFTPDAKAHQYFDITGGDISEMKGLMAKTLKRLFPEVEFRFIPVGRKQINVVANG